MKGVSQMQINGVNANTNAAVNNPANGGNSNNNNVVAPVATAGDVQDIVEISGQQPQTQQAQQANNNQRFRPDRARMAEIREDQSQHMESFRRLVETLLTQQAQRAGGNWNFNDPSAMVDIDEATRTAAQEAIDEGGPFSVEAVATRLLDFAVAISGGDPSRIATLRSAVERGFEAAERQWGGQLPDISQRTRDAVMEGFDQWQEAGDAGAITLLSNR